MYWVLLALVVLVPIVAVCYVWNRESRTTEFHQHYLCDLSAEHSFWQVTAVGNLPALLVFFVSQADEEDFFLVREAGTFGSINRSERLSEEIDSVGNMALRLSLENIQNVVEWAKQSPDLDWVLGCMQIVGSKGWLIMGCGYDVGILVSKRVSKATMEQAADLMLLRYEELIPGQYAQQTLADDNRV